MPDNAGLLPNQKWFLDELYPAMVAPGRWSLARMFLLPPDVSEREVRTAVQAVWSSHESLRAQFTRGSSGWGQRFLPADSPAPFSCVSAAALPSDTREAYIDQFAQDVRAQLSIDAGRLLHFARIEVGPGERSRLLLVGHHLLLDAFSVRIIGGDLETAFQALRQGDAPVLGAHARLADCIETLHEFAQGDLEAEQDYWDSLPWRETASLPAQDVPANTMRLWETRTTETDLSKLPGIERLSGSEGPNDPERILLACVADALTRSSGGSVWGKVMNHGRDLRNPSTGTRILPFGVWRTVGWFATSGIHLFPARDGLSVAEYIEQMVSRMDQVPNRGVGLSLLRWLRPVQNRAPAIDAIWSSTAFLFDYRGVSRARAENGALVETWSKNTLGNYHDLGEPRLPLHVRGRLRSDSLRIAWDFDPLRSDTSWIADVAESVLTSIEETLCQGPLSSAR